MTQFVISTYSYSQVVIAIQESLFQFYEVVLTIYKSLCHVYRLILNCFNNIYFAIDLTRYTSFNQFRMMTLSVLVVVGKMNHFWDNNGPHDPWS